MPDFDKIITVDMQVKRVRDAKKNVYNATQIKQLIFEAANDWAITRVHGVKILKIDVNIIDDWTGVAIIELSNNQVVKMKVDDEIKMIFSVNGITFEQDFFDSYHSYDIAVDALYTYDRLYHKIEKHFKENPVDISKKLKRTRDIGVFEMKHIMLFETYYGPLAVRIFQGFNDDNAQYFEEALDLAVDCVAEYFGNVPNAKHNIRQDVLFKINRDLSLFALDPNNNVVGVIFLKDESIFNEIEKHQRVGFEVTVEKDLTAYRNKKGLHGFLFGVKKEDRKSYIAWMLMQEVLKRFKNDFDYFYGIQAEMFRANIKYDKRAQHVATIQPMHGYKAGYFYLKEL